MKDGEYILMIVFFAVVIILVNIWRLKIKRRLTDEEKQHIKSKQVNIEEKFDDDLVSNPGYSFLEFNIFHKDRYDNDD